MPARPLALAADASAREFSLLYEAETWRLARIDADAHVVWDSPLPAKSSDLGIRTGALAARADGGLAVVGESDPGTGWIGLVDSDGNLRAETEIVPDGGAEITLAGVATATDGSIWVAGGIRPPRETTMFHPPAESKVWVGRLDEGLNLVWQTAPSANESTTDGSAAQIGLREDGTPVVYHLTYPFEGGPEYGISEVDMDTVGNLTPIDIGGSSGTVTGTQVVSTMSLIGNDLVLGGSKAVTDPPACHLHTSAVERRSSAGLVWQSERPYGDPSCFSSASVTDLEVATNHLFATVSLLQGMTTSTSVETYNLQGELECRATFRLRDDSYTEVALVATISPTQAVVVGRSDDQIGATWSTWLMPVRHTQP